jgi:DNA (cytosine-5)-methyltransferase 1
MKSIDRRQFLSAGASAAVASAFPSLSFSQKAMRRRKIPSSGEEIPVCGLGSSPIFMSTPEGSEDVTTSVIRAMFDMGGRMIDTPSFLRNIDPVLGQALKGMGLLEESFISAKITVRGKEAGGRHLERLQAALGKNPLDLLMIHNMMDLSSHWPTLKEWKDSGRARYIGVTQTEPDFSFIDLFAGIGGMRLAFEKHAGRCVFTSEWDSYSQETYLANFNVEHDFVGDITRVPADAIPNHDLLLAGFPCQPFSLAGISKKNSLGRKHGFECDTQGTLFFDIERIIAEKKPAAFLLENVKNLKSHDKGNTFKVIMHTLREKLGYQVFEKIIDAKGFVPQHRERVFIVGFKEPTEFTWDDLNVPRSDSKSMADVLHPENGSELTEEPYTYFKQGRVNEKYTLSDKLWSYLQNYAAKHRAAGNGFGFGLVSSNDTARTLSARYYKDGSEILVKQRGKNPRRLTPRECARLMGYETADRHFEIPVSDTRAYQQFGNGLVVPVVEEIARIMKPHLACLKDRDDLQNPTGERRPEHSNISL